MTSSERIAALLADSSDAAGKAASIIKFADIHSDFTNAVLTTEGFETGVDALREGKTQASLSEVESCILRARVLRSHLVALAHTIDTVLEKTDETLGYLREISEILDTHDEPDEL